MAGEPMWRDTTVEALVSPGYETLKSDVSASSGTRYEPSYTAVLRYPPAIKFLSSHGDQPDRQRRQRGRLDSTTRRSTRANHHIVAFQAGDALVVNFGTNQWGWGLSDDHVRGVGGDERHDAAGHRQPARRHGLPTGHAGGRSDGGDQPA